MYYSRAGKMNQVAKYIKKLGVDYTFVSPASIGGAGGGVDKSLGLPGQPVYLNW